MSQSIINSLKEIESIEKEIKSQRMTIKKLQDRKRQLEADIQGYITEKNQPGFTYEDKVVILDKKSVVKRKTKSQKQADQIEALKALGITNPNEVLQIIQKTSKGNSVESERVKIKSLKK